jgi:pimeloyl-ACP methyl ester carboxylesterase
MHPLALAAGALLAMLLATWAHHAFWTWRLRAPGREDELVRAHTSDGWSLALGRRRPRGPRRGPPVLLLHGLAVNRLFVDFGVERWSLSAHLAAAGFDCFALDLRGHGASRSGPARDWTFDDYLDRDLPAALDAVRAATGDERVLLVGHSQGALLALTCAARHPGRVAAVAALAGPVRLGNVPRLAALAFEVRFMLRFLARMAAPFAGLVHLRLASIETRNVERPVLRRFLANAVEDVATGVARQIRRWIAEGRFDSLAGEDYRALLTGARAPALFVVAPRDEVAPPPAVLAGYDAWGGPRDLVVAGRAQGFACDYGHGDLVFGRHAPDEVFPRVRDWLLARTAR